MATKVETVDVVKRIKEIRESQKISQEKMAELINMTFSNYQKIENAYQNITVKHLRNVCKVLKVSADVLLFGDVGNKSGFNYDNFIKWSGIFSDHEIDDTIKKLLEIKNIKKMK